MPVVHTISPIYIPFIMAEGQNAPIHSPTAPKWRVTAAQKDRLLKAFAQEPYPDPNRKARLAAELGVTGTQVSKWFQHKRESLTRLGQFKAQYNRSRRTEHELQVLQKAYEEDSYPSAERLAQLEAELTNVTSKQIKLWFKHRRKQSRHRSLQTSAQQKGGAAGPRSPTDQEKQSVSKPDSRPVVLPHDYIPGQIPPISTPASSVYPPFSHYELMALRGALCMSKQFPTQQGLQALSTYLGRPQDQLNIWFQEEIQGGFFWNYLADINSTAFASDGPSSQGLFSTHHNLGAVPHSPVTQPTGSYMRGAVGQTVIGHGNSDEISRSKALEGKGTLQIPPQFVSTQKWIGPLPLPGGKVSERESGRGAGVYQHPVMYHPEGYGVSHHPLAAQSISESVTVKGQEVTTSHGASPFAQYQPVWYCAPNTPQGQLSYGTNRSYGPPSATASPVIGDMPKK